MSNPNVHRYTPGFVTRDEEASDHQRAESLEQLLEIDWVKSWMRDIGDDRFHRFSISRSKHQNMLMAELNQGDTWWVVCHLDDPDLYGLPTWDDDGRATRISNERSRKREEERQAWLKANPDTGSSPFQSALKSLYTEDEIDG